MTFSNKAYSPKKYFEQSLKEMNLMRKSKMKKATWKEFKKTLETKKINIDESLKRGRKLLEDL